MIDHLSTSINITHNKAFRIYSHSTGGATALLQLYTHGLPRLPDNAGALAE